MKHGNIRDLDKFNQSLPEWSMLDGCFPRNIRPTDIDGCVETNGYCLYLEHKLPRIEIDTGQLRTMFAQVRQGNTVIVFWGRATDGSDITHMRVMHPDQAPHKTSRKPARLADLRAVAKAWFDKADQGPPHPAVEAAKRRENRLASTRQPAPAGRVELDHRPCISCNTTPTRVWPVPQSQQAEYGPTVSYCQMCEPFEGEALTAWGGE